MVAAFRLCVNVCVSQCVEVVEFMCHCVCFLKVYVSMCMVTHVEFMCQCV